jgi:ADP-heptose:LPS heptosyltransferase
MTATSFCLDRLEPQQVCLIKPSSLGDVVHTLPILMISNDTGPLHLAAAAGAWVVGIYTCTNPALTGPYRPRAAAVPNRAGCTPNFRRSRRRLESMSELTPDRVWAVIQSQLEQAMSNSRELATKAAASHNESSDHSGSVVPKSPLT